MFSTCLITPAMVFAWQAAAANALAAAMMAVLPGIDANDEQKTLAAFRFFCIVLSSVGELSVRLPRLCYRACVIESPLILQPGFPFGLAAVGVAVCGSCVVTSAQMLGQADMRGQGDKRYLRFTRLRFAPVGGNCAHCRLEMSACVGVDGAGAGPAAAGGGVGGGAAGARVCHPEQPGGA